MQLKNILLNLVFLILTTGLFAQLDNKKIEKTDAFIFQPDPVKEDKKLSIDLSTTIEQVGEIITRFGTLKEISSNFPDHKVIPDKRPRRMQERANTNKDILYKKFWNGNDVSITKLETKLELGKLETNTKRIRIECRDHSYVDGDRVKLYVNEVVIRSSITLQAGYYAIDIDLLEGYNRIDIQALNQGSSGPNTAEFKVYDGHGNLLADQEWNILTGYVATLVVIKN